MKSLLIYPPKAYSKKSVKTYNGIVKKYTPVKKKQRINISDYRYRRAPFKRHLHLPNYVGPKAFCQSSTRRDQFSLWEKLMN
jgi:hypothetical protein